MGDKNPITHFAWIDLETTGLDPEMDYILEVAMILTDTDLQPVQANPLVHNVLYDHDKWLNRLEVNSFVRQMHEKNGLTNQLLHGQGVPLNEVQLHIVRTLSHWCDPQEVMIAGATVGFDLKFIQAHMPLAARWLHSYQTLDISPMRRFVRHVVKRDDLLPPDVDDSHRAFSDVSNALGQAHHFKKLLGGLHGTA